MNAVCLKMMRKVCILFLILMATVLPLKSHGQVQELAQLALDIEKLSQFKRILQDMYQGYKLLTDGYDKVKNIASGNYRLHEAFLDALYQVSPEVKKYHKVAEIIQYQIQLSKQYKDAMRDFRSNSGFSINELDFLDNMYSNISKASLKNLDDLLAIITPNTIRASDEERIKVIDAIHSEMLEKVDFFKRFTSSSIIMDMQKRKEASEIKAVGALYDQRN
ncbi:TerB family tellurite resistance protein [Chitinophaga eiseniae]|uniref:TerB family tellurite resistance protein n=1 Tax=Chitinophaga eiseniae TaxID=634771 RepID=A0A847SKW0_9BACT|nr:TerB family tellurite resistance protein [Chitinophaga eiseniae]NLR78026.1 TerB family tellurite resistance protein [Chitinophaga eiseniae]